MGVYIYIYTHCFSNSVLWISFFLLICLSIPIFVTYQYDYLVVPYKTNLFIILFLDIFWKFIFHMSSNIILIIINCYFNPNYIKVMYFWQLILLLYVLKKINACLFHCIFYWVLQTYLIFSAYRSCNFLVKFITNFFFIFLLLL